MKKLSLLLAVALTVGMLVLTGCARSAPSSGTGFAPPAPAPGISQSNKGTSSSGESLSDTSIDRMIVRNSNLSLVVLDITKSRDQISQLAVSLGGYVVSSSISGSGHDLTGRISIRVPDGKFEQVISQIRGLAVKVDNESTSSQDITEEYLDLESRLKNAQATESQYLALLSKASTVQDILSIQDKLSQTRQQIEQIKGRMQYLEQTSAMSLIAVSLSPEGSNNPITWLDWNFGQILKLAVSGFIIFLQVLFGIIIWVAIFSPVWGSIVGLIYWRRHRKKSH
jgi:hypothetical protein